MRRALQLALGVLLLTGARDAPRVELLAGPPALKTLMTQLQAGDRPVVLHFFATWCDSCRKEAPVLRQVLAHARDSNAAVALISLDDLKTGTYAVSQFLARQDLHDPAYLLDAPEPDPVTDIVDPAWKGDLPATFVFRGGKRVASFLRPLKDPAALDHALGR